MSLRSTLSAYSFQFFQLLQKYELRYTKFSASTWTRFKWILSFILRIVQRQPFCLPKYNTPTKLVLWSARNLRPISWNSWCLEKSEFSSKFPKYLECELFASKEQNLMSKQFIKKRWGEHWWYRLPEFSRSCWFRSKWRTVELFELHIPRQNKFQYAKSKTNKLINWLMQQLKLLNSYSEIFCLKLRN